MLSDNNSVSGLFFRGEASMRTQTSEGHTNPTGLGVWLKRAPPTVRALLVLPVVWNSYSGAANMHYIKYGFQLMQSVIRRQHSI